MDNSFILATDRLRLREMLPEDFPALAGMLQDPEVMYAWERTFNDDEVRAWIDRNRLRYRNHGCGYWLAVTADGEVVGQTGLLYEDIAGVTHLGVGWIFRRAHWGKGYALEAGRACIEYAFRQLQAPRIVADIRPENRNSVKVAERLGLIPGLTVVKEVYGKPMPHQVFSRPSWLVGVADYDPAWQEEFRAVERYLAPLAAEFGARLEHVGSTAVPGLAAKPVIDIDLVLPEWEAFDALKERLARLGFLHRGNLGLEGREMFSECLRFSFRHNFYVCRAGGQALENHLLLRDFLRRHPGAARRYGDLKRLLAARYPDDIDGYCSAKSPLIAEFLAAAGMAPDAVEAIRKLNEE